MRDPHGAVVRYLTRNFDAFGDPDPWTRAAYRQIDREEEAHNQHFLDWSPDQAQQFGEALGQQRLALTEEDERANVRHVVADYLERVVIPRRADCRMDGTVQKLRVARRTGTWMFRPDTGRLFLISDDKAGLPLLCPDDARDAANRLHRRYTPPLLEWATTRGRVHTAVLTSPNVAPGKLSQAMRAEFARFKRVVIDSGEFPEVRGALVTLEAPLGHARDWNVHLNVVFVCDGFFDYAKLRRLWHWQVEISPIVANPLKGESIEVAIARNLREIVKYPVQAMPTKSAAKQKQREREGRPAPPALIEWTEAEFSEWYDAHYRFRRTRSYGELYGIDAPEPESMAGCIAIGSQRTEGRCTVKRRFPLLDSIPGDKSIGNLGSVLAKLLKRELRPPIRAADMAALANAAQVASWKVISATQESSPNA